MKRFLMSSFMLMLAMGAVCTTSKYNMITHETTETDSIEETVSEIKLPVVHILTEDSIEPSCQTIMHPEGCIGQSITENHYVKGSMTIHDGDELLYNSGEYEKGTGGMRIKVRGNTSADFPYKSFKVKTEVKTDMLNRDDEKYESRSWVLLNIYSTRDLRVVTGFEVAKLMGAEWEPEYKFVNLFINGEYRGLYMLSESIEAGEGRCNLEDETGLLMEDDAYWWNEGADEPVIKTDSLPYEAGYTFKHPKLNVDDPVLDEIKDYLNAFEDSLYNGRDISRYIDYESFARWILTHDLLGGWDAAGSNIYIKKDDFLGGEDNFNTKLEMGPLWDFDSIFKTQSKWADIHIGRFFYFRELFKRPDFIIVYQELWNDVREEIGEKINSFIDDFAEQYGEAIDQSRLISPPGIEYWPSTISDDVKEVKDWFEKRISWMDDEIPEMLQAVSVTQVQDSNRIVSVTISDIDGRICGKYRGTDAERIFNSKNTASRILKAHPGIYIMYAEYEDGTVVSRKHVIFNNK